MKFAILGDTHFGMRNDSTKFHEYYEKFYTESFFPYLKEHNIDTVVQLGDLFDRRKYINFLSLQKCRNYFFDILKENNIQFHTLLGNHDIFWKESVQVNSTGLLLKDYDNITLYDKPSKLNIGAVSIDMIPWVCLENEDEVLNFMSESKSDLCFGHFEIAGFAMYRGLIANEGIERDIFKNYHLVCSGHYHTRSKNDNIVYVGTPGEITWQDYNDPKGFHVFDDQTMELEFIENPYNIYAKITYDDTEPLNWEMTHIDPKQYKDKFIKLVVVAKNDHLKFDTLLNSLYHEGVHEVKIVEDLTEFEQGEVDENIDLEDTLDVLDNYIESVQTEHDKEKIKKYMRELYIEATNVEVV